MISDSGRNPAALLRARYEDLMVLECPDDLHVKANRIVSQSQISTTNHRRWSLTMARIQGNLAATQSYISNFILAADGHSVI